MYWKQQLKELEDLQKWDDAIALMQHVVQDNPNNSETFIFLNFLLMNLLAVEDYNIQKHDYYARLLKESFVESYAKFSHDAAYLFYTAKTASMSSWYLDVDTDFVNKMLETAALLDPENMVYQWPYYVSVAKKNPQNKDLLLYIQNIFEEHSSIQQELKNKGKMGAYILNMMQYWAKHVISGTYTP